MQRISYLSPGVGRDVANIIRSLCYKHILQCAQYLAAGILFTYLLLQYPVYVHQKCFLHYGGRYTFGGEP